MSLVDISSLNIEEAEERYTYSSPDNVDSYPKLSSTINY